MIFQNLMPSAPPSYLVSSTPTETFVACILLLILSLGSWEGTLQMELVRRRTTPPFLDLFILKGLLGNQPSSPIHTSKTSTFQFSNVSHSAPPIPKFYLDYLLDDFCLEEEAQVFYKLTLIIYFPRRKQIHRKQGKEVGVNSPPTIGQQSG